MSYRVKIHVRHSTVFVIVVLLMGSVLYEVTRTESFGRQSAARTQDIALPAPQAVVHTVRASANFIGNSSAGRSAIQPLQPDRELLATAAYGSATVATAAFFHRDFAPRGFGSAFNGRSLNGRVRSSGGSGYAAGAYGMGGVGAWGGVSGMMRPVTTNLTDLPGRRVGQQSRTATPAPRKTGNKSGGGGTSGGGASGTDSLPGGFTTGAAAVEPGAVVSVEAGGTASQAPAPAPTPEPMSVLLVGTGLAALFKVRQHLQ